MACPDGTITYKYEKGRTFQFSRFSEPNSFSSFREYTDFISVSRRGASTVLPWGYVAQFNEVGKLSFIGSLDFTLRKYGSSLVKLDRGIYASWFFRGNIDEHLKFFKKKLKELRDRHKVLSPVYLFDQSSTLLLGTGEVFTTRYEIRIKDL